MDTITQLWIRACKSKNPHTRLRTLTRRFYCGVSDKLIISELANIVDDYCPMKAMDLVNELDSHFYVDLTQDEKLLRIFCSQIAFTKASEFTGMKTPTWVINRFGTQLESK